jgi:hypothetical protein
MLVIDRSATLQQMRSESIEVEMGLAVFHLFRSWGLVHLISNNLASGVYIRLVRIPVTRNQDGALDSEAAQFADEPLEIDLGPT